MERGEVARDPAEREGGKRELKLDANLPNSHPRRKTVRIHDQIRAKTLKHNTAIYA